MLLLLPGLSRPRAPTVQLFALLFQLPPRATRLVPDAPPYKVHTVFYSKIFEPLKRLTQCRSILFSKIYYTQQHILPVRFHRFTAMDGGGSILAMFCLGQNSKLKIGHGCPILSTSPAKCVNLGQTSQAEAKLAVPAARTVAEPSAYSAAARAVVPAAAAFNTVSTRRTTLRIGNNTALHISSIV